jgi:hypothetical protein
MEDFPPGPPNAFIAEELRIREAGALRQALARDQFSPSTGAISFRLCADNGA